MKKLLLSLVTLVYMMMSTGIAMDTHYCMGRKGSTELFSTGDSACAKCGMQKRPGCCHDEHRLLKMSAEHKAATVPFSQQPLMSSTAKPLFSFAALLPPTIRPLLMLHSPPDIPSPGICICCRNFRI